ncbi:MAG: hypothetical protein WBF33_06850 [Candidatus Nitrosopolaris sp.]|jgi:hypothetical protein
MRPTKNKSGICPAVGMVCPMTISDFVPTVILSIVSIVSLTLFIIVERKISTKVKAAKKIPTSSSSSPMAATDSPLTYVRQGIFAE